MNILILEDEKLAAERLERQILNYDKSFKILAKIDSVRNGIAWFENNPLPNLVFSDIQLSDGPSFNIFDTLNIDVPLIFTTAYSEFAIKAFKYTSIDYLLKPINQANLNTAINKYQSFNKSTTNIESIKSAQSIITNDYKKRFLIKIGEQFIPILSDDILYFYSKEKISYLKTKDHKNYIIDYSLDQIEKLVSPVSFFRINRQYIITYMSITKIVTHFNGKLKVDLSNCKDEDIFVSRERVNNFKNWLDL